MFPSRVSTVALCLSLGALVAGAAPPKATDAGDHVVFGAGTDLSEAALPRGPLTAAQTVLGEFQEIRGLATHPDAPGDLFMLRRRYLPFEPPRDEVLVRQGAGELQLRGQVDLSVPFEAYEPADLAFTADGRLFLLYTFFWWNPPDSAALLVEVDPDDAEVLSELSLADDSVYRLATTRTGTWALSGLGVQRLDLASGGLTPTSLPLPASSSVLDADGDSTGALWLLAEPSASPGTRNLYRLDPATGSLRGAATPHPADANRLAVRRSCSDSPTAICLQGGRFQIEADWRIPSGGTGVATVGPSRSADSAVLWFFDPSNWELLVKVLDACGTMQPRFWVFTAGTTNVEYQLRVTDLQTGDTNFYDNLLGETAETVTDTNAFATCPQ